MKERVILSPKANSTELIRTLARFNNREFLLRIFNTSELVRFMLSKASISLDEKYISNKEATLFIYSLLKEVDYFKDNYSFKDAKNVYDALNSLRSLCLENEEKTMEENLLKGEFLNKNRALLRVYQLYIKYLNDNKAIDSIGLIRKVLECREDFGIEYYVLKEYPLTALERKLIDTLSFGQYKEISFYELLNKKEQKIVANSYTKAYGQINEIDHIISHIIKNEIPLDECEIVALNPNYLQTIYDESQKLSIPLTFKDGVPIVNFNASSVLKLIKSFIYEKNRAFARLNELINSNCFDRAKLLETIECNEKDLERLLKVAGKLRISFDREINTRVLSIYLNSKKQKCESLIKLFDEFSKGISYIIENYTKKEKETESEAIALVCDYLKTYASLPLKEVIDEILGKNIKKENSDSGKLHVSNLTNACDTLRKNVFIVGLSASNFPPSSKENYLTLDSDLLCFDDEALTSVKKVDESKKSLIRLLENCSALDIRVHLSYSDYNLAELKMENPSSVLYDIYKINNKNASIDEFNSQFKETMFFEHGLSKYDDLMKSYSEGAILIGKNKEEKVDSQHLDLLKRRYSPTAIDKYFNCPRMFYLECILGLKQREESEELVNAAEFGTLIHSLMEYKANRSYSKEEFLKLANTLFDSFLSSANPLYFDEEERNRMEFLEVGERCYNDDPNNKVISSEKDRECVLSNGLRIHGFADRIEKDSEGKIIIADYKTGKNIKHNEDDIETCLQVLMYAYIAEANGIKVDRTEYRYVRLSSIVKCRYDEEMKTRLLERLDDFALGLSRNYFPLTDKDDNCTFCSFCNVCGKKKGDV